MQDSQENNQVQKEFRLFEDCLESAQSDPSLQNQKKEASCAFYYFKPRNLSRNHQQNEKECLILEIRGEWVCQVSASPKRILSKFRCGRHYSFQVLRRKDEGDSGDWLAVGLLLWVRSPRESPLTLHVEEKRGHELQQFVSVLQAKLIIQRGFETIFKPIRRLGRGVTSVVYSALNMVNRKMYAVKSYSRTGNGSHSPEIRELVFQKEFKIWRSLDHPHIGKLVTAFESQNSVYMVTEQLYITLYTFIRSEGFFKKHIAKKIIKDLLSALHYLHQKGIMHRDIKLENIMLDKESLISGAVRAIIIDFGFAEELSEKRHIFPRCGTPGYTAPEILAMGHEVHQQGEKYNEKCDVFSLGVVAYTLLLKKSPFPGANPQQIEQKNALCQIEYSSEMLESIGQAGVDFLTRLMDRQPRNRMTCSQALSHAFLEEELPSVPPSKTLIGTREDLLMK